MFCAFPSPTVVFAALLALAIGGFVTIPAGAAVPPAYESADSLLGADLSRGASPLILDEARGYAPPAEEARGYAPLGDEARGYQPATEEARGYAPLGDEARGYQPAIEEARGSGPRHLDVAMGAHSRYLIREFQDDSRPEDDAAGADRALVPLTA
jgi:hypothetical protein